MEQVLHRGITTGFVAVIAGTGLLAVAPAAPPRLDLREVAVQLTTAADAFTDIANAAASASDLFTQLGDNLSAAASNLSTGVTHLLQLHLADAVVHLRQR